VIIHYVFLKGSYRRSAYNDSSCPLKNTHTHTKICWVEIQNQPSYIRHQRLDEACNFLHR